MGCIKFEIPKLSINLTPQNWKKDGTKRMKVVVCGLRKEGKRKPLWRKSFLSSEAIQAVQTLKLAHNSSVHNKLELVFNTKVTRLLKTDLLDTLSELQRQNEIHLSLMVFEFVRKEVWYEPDTTLYCNMILMFGKNKLIESVENIFSELKREGLEPDTRVYAEMIGAYFKVDMLQKAINMYELMMSSGCIPDKLTLTILVRNLEKCEEQELVARIKKECADCLDSSSKIFKEVERKHESRR